MVIAGDIGGTKTELGLFDTHGQMVKKVHYENAGIEQFDILLHRFFKECEINEHKECQLAGSRSGVSGICLGVAGPVQNGRCQMTNLPWCLDAQLLQKQFGVPCLLINDLEAMAWSLPFLPASEFVQLQGKHEYGPRNPDVMQSATQVTAIMSVGTGLGEAALVSSPNGYGVLPSEGGHKNFAPRGVDDVSLLLETLKQDAGTQVSAEHLISGMGLPRLLAHTGGEGSLMTLSQEPEFGLVGATALIIRYGLEQPRSLYGEVLRRFVAMMAHEASNLALQYRAEGGVVIGGGIPPRLLSLLDTPNFREQFADKRTHHQWLRSLSVRLCINASAPLWGAYHCLRSANSGQRLL